MKQVCSDKSQGAARATLVRGGVGQVALCFGWRHSILACRSRWAAGPRGARGGGGGCRPGGGGPGAAPRVAGRVAWWPPPRGGRARGAAGGGGGGCGALIHSRTISRSVDKSEVISSVLHSRFGRITPGHLPYQFFRSSTAS